MAQRYKARALALAKRIGATIEEDGDEINCEAPAGFVWAPEGIHELVNSPWDGDRKADMWKQAFTRMSAGVEPCPHGPSCDWCADAAAEDPFRDSPVAKGEAEAAMRRSFVYDANPGHMAIFLLAYIGRRCTYEGERLCMNAAGRIAEALAAERSL